MPELPDVELQRRFVERHARGNRFAEVTVWEATKILTGTTTPELSNGLAETEIVGTERLGKYLLCYLSSEVDTLIFHFGMTGYLAFLTDQYLYIAGGAEAGGGERRLPGSRGLPDKTKARFTFGNGNQLAFVNVRLLGSIFLIRDIAAFRRAHGIGPDALSLSREEFRQILRGRGSVKSTLMNQKKLSGIGNVYSDEILFHAGVHPKCTLTALSDAKRDAIFDALHTVMETAIAYEADPAQYPGSYLTPHRQTGTGRSEVENAMRTDDGWKLDTMKIGGRTAYFAPEKQSSCG